MTEQKVVSPEIAIDILSYKKSKGLVSAQLIVRRCQLSFTHQNLTDPDERHE
jgi:hypothetical protein